jgi:hypothetical protein
MLRNGHNLFCQSYGDTLFVLTLMTVKRMGNHGL